MCGKSEAGRGSVATRISRDPRRRRGLPWRVRKGHLTVFVDGKREMRMRSFGRLGWEVSEVGYGTWGMGAWTGSDDAG